MIQNWSIRSRATHCALSERPFTEGEVFHTAIYFDPETNGYVRRDVAIDVWPQEIAARKPIAYWRTTYTPNVVEAKPEMTSKESAMTLLQRFIEEDDPMTENARYILALMLERKRILSPTATKEVDGNKMLFYENKKTGEVFIVRDPELRLDELATVQDEVAMLLGFGGPAAEAAKVAGMKFTPDGKLVKADEAPAGTAPQEAEAPAQAEEAAEPSTSEPIAEADQGAAVLHPVITIDGPAASGKSSVAKLVARQREAIYVNTGNMYRAMTWAVLDRGIDPNDSDAVRTVSGEVEIASPVVDGQTQVQVNGRALNDADLNSDPVNRAVSLVARVPEVRERLVAAQRALASIGPLVMEGRDIGSVVFPDSPLKFYIDASEEVRAARRRAQGHADQVAERDRLDSTRKTSPLVIPEGAVVIDNSHLTLEEAVQQVLNHLP